MPIEPPPSRFSTEPTAEPDAVSDSVKSAVASLQEARAYFSQYLSAKVDGAKTSARNLVVYAIIGVVAAIIGMTALVTATVLLMVGIAHAIGKIFDPDMPWLGGLLVGLLLLGAVVGGVLMLFPMMAKRSREATVKKYEAMARRQQMDYGHSAAQRAAQPEHANGR